MTYFKFGKGQQSINITDYLQCKGVKQNKIMVTALYLFYIILMFQQFWNTSNIGKNALK